VVAVGTYLRWLDAAALRSLHGVGPPSPASGVFKWHLEPYTSQERKAWEIDAGAVNEAYFRQGAISIAPKGTCVPVLVKLRPVSGVLRDPVGGNVCGLSAGLQPITIPLQFLQQLLQPSCSPASIVSVSLLNLASVSPSPATPVELSPASLSLQIPPAMTTFTNIAEVCRKLGVSRRAMLKVLSTLVFRYVTPRRGSVEVGLNLWAVSPRDSYLPGYSRYNAKKGEKVPTVSKPLCSRCGGSVCVSPECELSDAAIAVLQAYLTQFPDVFKVFVSHARCVIFVALPHTQSAVISWNAAL
jgi:hypothetical protein